MTKAFVSYAQADREAAERLVKELERLNITTTFLDRLVSPGDFWAAKLQSAIADSDVVFILISRESLKSEWVQRRDCACRLSGGTWSYSGCTGSAQPQRRGPTFAQQRSTDYLLRRVAISGAA